MKIDGAEPVLFKNVFPTTPSGKIELRSSHLDKHYDRALPEYRPLQSDFPLYLVTPSSDKRVTSTFGGLKAGDAPPPLEMHPEDALARGLKEGQQVKVWNELGEVYLPLKITTAVRPGVVYSEKGAWFKTTPNQQTVSALAPLHKADIANGACYNDCRVEVEVALQ